MCVCVRAYIRVHVYTHTYILDNENFKIREVTPTMLLSKSWVLSCLEYSVLTALFKAKESELENVEIVYCPYSQ